MPVKMKAILPRKFNEGAFVKPLEQSVKDTIDEADREFAKTYATWNHEPVFIQSFSASDIRIEGQTVTTDDKYGFITRGTSVRYATMTRDFEAKTQPGLIDSRPGSGGVLYVDKRRPRPGIKARRFEEEIAKIEEPKFAKRVNDAISEGRKASGHAI